MKHLNLINELSDNKIILLLIPGMDYNLSIVDLAKQLSGKNVCYVTLNKTFDSLKELFKKNNLLLTFLEIN